MATDTATPVTLPPGTYYCLACGRVVDLYDGDELPGDGECSHQFEAVAPEMIRRRPEIVGYFHGADQPTPF